jgi:hypothetical protein
MDLKESGTEEEDAIHLTPNRIQLQYVVYMEINRRITQNAGNFFYN